MRKVTIWRDTSLHAHRRKLCQEETAAIEFFMSFDFGEDVGEMVYYGNNEAADAPWDSLIG